MAGADLSDLDHLPTMVVAPKPVSVSHKRKEREEDDEQPEESEEMAVEAPARKVRRRAKPKAEQKHASVETSVGASP